jgi:hypothetical protein
MFPEPPASSPTPLALTEQQQVVARLLSGFPTKVGSLADWYLGALEAIARKGPDYLAQAANSIRELTEHLPDFADIPKYKHPLSHVKQLLSKFRSLRVRRYAAGWEGQTITGELFDLFKEMEDVSRVFDAPARTARLGIALTARDPLEGLLPASLRRERDRLFKELSNFFQAVTHHGRFPSEPEFIENLNAFENLLCQYLTPVSAEQQLEISNIIAQEPSVERKARLQLLVRHSGANLALLLEKLERTDWLSFLVDLKLFESLPEPEPIAGGGIILRPSAVLTTLARLAPRVPGEALSIIEALPNCSNDRVTGQIMRCISFIQQPELAPRLLAVVKPLLGRHGSEGWMWLDDIFKAWMKMGATEEVIGLLRAFLFVIAPMREEVRANEIEWKLGQIDEQVVVPLASSQPLEIAKIVFRALREWAAFERTEGEIEPTLFGIAEDPDAMDKADGPATYWLDDLRVSTYGSNNFQGILARRLYWIGGKVLGSGHRARIEAFDHLLRSDPWQLFCRIRWQLYADYPEQSLEFARNDVVARITDAGSVAFYYELEFAQMVETHTQTNGAAFLGPEDVATFVNAVLAGPRQRDGEDSDRGFRDRFQRTQLHLIKPLLIGEGLAAYQRLSERKPPLDLARDRRLSLGGGGTVQSVAPKQANEMHSMSDEDLWTFLNNWEPTQRFPDPDNWLVEEDAGALGFKFSEYLETHPERFPPESRWWENLRRPAMLHKPLERATVRIGKKPNDGEPPPLAPCEADWRNWFGIAAWITEQRPIVPAEDADKAERVSHEQLDWNWPRIVVVKFLTTALEGVFNFPEELRPDIGRLLRKLVEEEDPRLAGKDRPWIDDWLNTAINSVRGTALEGLMDLAVSQKKESREGGPEPWIFNVIAESLRHPDQSPAVFAILGARAGLLLSLFGERLGDATHLLLPEDRHNCAAAFVLAHFHYHNAMPAILRTLPALPEAALSCVVELDDENEDRRRARRDFVGRLGFHLAFYYWNSAYQTEEAGDTILDRFFEIAKPASRGMTIGEIGRLFESAHREPKHAALFERVIKLWDRRFSHIEKLIDSRQEPATDFQAELSAFTDWMACECFPFDWRYDRVLRAIDRLEKSPQVYSLIETLDRITGSGEHLHEAMTILHAVTSKAGDEVRWAYREERLKPFLRRGLASANADTKKLAEEIQETLLRHGCFEYLDIEEKNPAVDPQ